jgi:hypothetical protein
MEPESKIITRSSKPHSYDHAVRGTICKVIRPFDPVCDVYRQISAHSDVPIWEFIGTMNKDSVVPPLI